MSLEAVTIFPKLAQTVPSPGAGDHTFMAINAPTEFDAAALWLCQLPGMTASLALDLVATSGSPVDVMRAPSSVLRGCGVAPALIAQVVAGPRQLPHVLVGLKAWQRLGIVPIPLVASSYPQRLRALPNPPLVIYLQGRWPLDQPLVYVAGHAALDEHGLAGWSTLSQLLQPQVGFTAGDSQLTAGSVPPTLVGLSYGLMLARARLAADLMRRTAAGTTTLISVSSPTAQPDPLAASGVTTALVALSDAAVLLPAALPDAAAVLDAARVVNIPVFAFGAAARTPLPNGVRRLRSGKSGLHTLRRLLGVHDLGSDAVQQERLF